MSRRYPPPARPARHREIPAELQRHRGRQQYYVQLAAAVTIALSEGYGLNLGYDYGSRLVAAWLDR